MIPKSQELASMRNLQKEGNQLSDEGKIVQAIEKYQQALQIDPEFFPALNRLAVIYENNQEFDLAVAYNQRAIQSQPDCAIAYARLGRIMMKQGEMEKAIDAYEKSVSLTQPPNWVYLELGNTLEKIGQMEKALDLWQKTIDKSPLLWQAYHRKGQILELQQKWEEAASAYEMVCRINPQQLEIEPVLNRQILALKSHQRLILETQSFVSHLEFQSLEFVTGLIEVAIMNNQPFSVIRLGDGEGRVLGYPEFYNEDDKRLLNNLSLWLRKHDIDRIGVRQLVPKLQQILYDAAMDADVLGLPSDRTSRSNTGGILRLNASQCREDSMACSSIYKYLRAYNFPFGQKWIASEFNTRNIYKLNQFYFLQNLPFIGIISSYNLKDKVAQAYQIKEVVHYAIPPERPDTKTDCLTSHYPDAIDRINSELKVPFTGAVFLVGAGLFGKFYCHLIKQRGGIAIDVGSLLDGWAGLGRPHIASCPQYQL